MSAKVEPVLTLDEAAEMTSNVLECFTELMWAEQVFAHPVRLADGIGLTIRPENDPSGPTIDPNLEYISMPMPGIEYMDVPKLIVELVVATLQLGIVVLYHPQPEEMSDVANAFPDPCRFT